jgi:hypothetical protein
METEKSYWEYWAELWRSCVGPAWSLSNGLPGGLIATVALLSAGPIHVLEKDDRVGLLVNGAFAFIVYAAVAWGVLLAIQMTIFAPFRFYITQAKRISELERVGADDPERLLNGRFIYNTFVYGGDIGRLCASYTSKEQIDQLKDAVTTIHVQAPKYSTAHVEFRFLNGRNRGPESQNAKCMLYYLGRNDELILIDDIYSGQEIPLDGAATFRLCMKWTEHFEISEKASLQISVRAWKK